MSCHNYNDRKNINIGIICSNSHHIECAILCSNPLTMHLSFTRRKVKPVCSHLNDFSSFYQSSLNTYSGVLTKTALIRILKRKCRILHISGNGLMPQRLRLNDVNTNTNTNAMNHNNDNTAKKNEQESKTKQ